MKRSRLLVLLLAALLLSSPVLAVGTAEEHEPGPIAFAWSCLQDFAADFFASLLPGGDEPQPPAAGDDNTAPPAPESQSDPMDPPGGDQEIGGSADPYG